MSKNLWLGIVAVLIIITVVGIWAFNTYGTRPGVSDMPGSEQASATSTPASAPEHGNSGNTTSRAEGTSAPSALRTALSQTQPHECVYRQVHGSVQSSATIDIANGKMGGAFRSTDAYGVAHNEMIAYDGTYLYVWQEGAGSGTKTRLSSISQLPSLVPSAVSNDATYGSSLDNVSWDCHSWVTNALVLKPPAGVAFTTR